MIAPAGSVELFEAPQAVPFAQTCGTAAAFPQFLTPALLGLLQIANPDKPALPQPSDGGLFITQAKIADMDEAAVGEGAQGTPRHKQRESEASLLPWLPPAIIPTQTSRVPRPLDPAVQREPDADVFACEAAALPGSGVTCGPVEVPRSATAPGRNASRYDCLPIDECHNAGLEEEVAELGAARPFGTMVRADQLPGSSDFPSEGDASSTEVEPGAVLAAGENRQVPLTEMEEPTESLAAGQEASPKEATSPVDAHSGANKLPEQNTAKRLEHAPARSIGRTAAMPPSRSSRLQETNERVDAAPVEEDLPADNVPAAFAPPATDFDSRETAQPDGTRTEVLELRGAAPLAPERAETRSVRHDMARGDRQEGAPIAKSSSAEPSEPRIFAFGMRLTPSDGKAHTLSAQPPGLHPGTPQHEPPAPACPAPATEQKLAPKKDLITLSNSKPVSSAQVPAASTADPTSAPAQAPGWVEEGVRAIGIQERPTPELRRGETPDSGAKAPIATHRAIQLHSKDAEATVPPSPLREIKLELGGGGERVSVKLSEHQGHVELAVHSRDAVLAGELRRDLPSLTAQIEQAGFRAETTRTGSNLAGDSRDGERWSEARDGAAGQGGGRQHRHQNPDERKKEFEWLFPTLGE